MPTFQYGKIKTMRPPGLVTNLQIELEGVRFLYNSFREILTSRGTCQKLTPQGLIPLTLFKPWLSCNSSGHPQEVCYDQGACAPHSLSIVFLFRFQGHWQIPSWPSPSTGLIIGICQLISMGKGGKTHWALSTTPDLVGVPFCSSWAWRNLCAPVFVMEITTHPYI